MHRGDKSYYSLEHRFGGKGNERHQALTISTYCQTTKKNKYMSPVKNSRRQTQNRGDIEPCKGNTVLSSLNLDLSNYYKKIIRATI